MDLDLLASNLGTTDLPATLDLLWSDVPGAVNVDDSHARFGEHVALLNRACDEWPDIEFQMDEAGSEPALMNSLTREVIRRIKSLME